MKVNEQFENMADLLPRKGIPVPDRHEFGLTLESLRMLGRRVNACSCRESRLHDIAGYSRRGKAAKLSLNLCDAEVKKAWSFISSPLYSMS